VEMNNHLGALASYVRNVVELAYFGQNSDKVPDGFDE